MKEIQLLGDSMTVAPTQIFLQRFKDPTHGIDSSQ
jgi:hypothetical protein